MFYCILKASFRVAQTVNGHHFVSDSGHDGNYVVYGDKLSIEVFEVLLNKSFTSHICASMKQSITFCPV